MDQTTQGVLTRRANNQQTVVGKIKEVDGSEREIFNVAIPNNQSVNVTIDWKKGSVLWVDFYVNSSTHYTIDHPTRVKVEPDNCRQDGG